MKITEKELKKLINEEILKEGVVTIDPKTGEFKRHKLPEYENEPMFKTLHEIWSHVDRMEYSLKFIKDLSNAGIAQNSDQSANQIKQRIERALFNAEKALSLIDYLKTQMIETRNQSSEKDEK